MCRAHVSPDWDCDHDAPARSASDFVNNALDL